MQNSHKKKSSSQGESASHLQPVNECHELGGLMQRFLLFVPADQAYKSLTELFMLHILRNDPEEWIDKEKMEDYYFMLKMFEDAAEVVNKK